MAARRRPDWDCGTAKTAPSTPPLLLLDLRQSDGRGLVTTHEVHGPAFLPVGLAGGEKEFLLART